MSQYFEADGVTLWNPATDRAQRFLTELQHLESALAMTSGIGPMISDEAAIDLHTLKTFAREVATSRLSDIHRETALRVVALAVRAGLIAAWPPPRNAEEAELLGLANKLARSMPH